MDSKSQRFSNKTKHDYDLAVCRYEEIKQAQQGSDEHAEKLSLVCLIEKYENKHWDLPEVDPVEMNKIRREDFGFRSPKSLA